MDSIIEMEARESTVVVVVDCEDGCLSLKLINAMYIYIQTQSMNWVHLLKEE